MLDDSINDGFLCHTLSHRVSLGSFILLSLFFSQLESNFALFVWHSTFHHFSPKIENLLCRSSGESICVDVFTCSPVYLYEHDPNMRFESLKSILGHNSKSNIAALG